jgi:hypothetical protein
MTLDHYIQQTVSPSLLTPTPACDPIPYADAMFFYFDMGSFNPSLFLQGRDAIDMGQSCVGCGESYWVFTVTSENDAPATWLCVEATSWSGSSAVGINVPNSANSIIAVRRTDIAVAELRLQFNFNNG